MSISKRAKKILFASSIFSTLTIFLLFFAIAISVVIFFIASSGSSSKEVDIEGLPDKITWEMVEGAVKSYEKDGVPAAVTLAQIILEAGDMESNLVKRDHNLFGIKYFGSGKEGVDFNYYKTSEQRSDGSSYSIRAKFKKFKSIQESIIAHGELLASDMYKSRVKDLNSSNSWADGLQGKYATDTQYASKLKSIMKQYDLYRFDGKKLADLKNLASSSYAGVEIKGNKFQKAILKSVSSYKDPYHNGYPGLCEAWVYKAYTKAGLSYQGSCCANAGRVKFATTKGKIPVGACIYSGTRYRSRHTCSYCGRNCGHVAIYLGDGKVAGSDPTFIRSLDNWISIYGYGGWSFNVNKVKGK